MNMYEADLNEEKKPSIEKKCFVVSCETYGIIGVFSNKTKAYNKYKELTKLQVSITYSKFNNVLNRKQVIAIPDNKLKMITITQFIINK